MRPTTIAGSTPKNGRQALPGLMVAARSAGDVRRAKEQGKIAVLIGIEGGYLIDDSLEVLREYHRRGAVYLTLTHAFHTSWADSSGVHESLSPRHHGLTDFGREVVRELNGLGMMVDVSHVSDETFWDVVETSAAPVIASHSSCRAVSSHRRNLTDEMIQAIAKSGGVVQINFAAAFVDPTFPPIDPKVVQYWSTRGGFEASPYARHVTPLSVLADHFDHAMKLPGADPKRTVVFGRSLGSGVAVALAAGRTAIAVHSPVSALARNAGGRISVRAFSAKISSSSRPAPAAMPRISSYKSASRSPMTSR